MKAIVSTKINTKIKALIPLGTNLNQICTNDWYDPDFQNTYVHDTEANINAALIDFAFISTNQWKIYSWDSQTKSIGFKSSGTSINNVTPAFTRAYFAELGYVTGDVLKFGCWVKFPNATTESTRAFYIGGVTAGAEQVVSNSDWRWFENVVTITVTDLTWQKFYMGFRYMPSGEFAYVRGFTLVNITQAEWLGESKSARFVAAARRQIVNRNNFVDKIVVNTPLYRNSSENSNVAFTKQILNFPERGLDGVRFTSSVATVAFKMNIDHSALGTHGGVTGSNYFNIPDQAGWVKYGFWVRVNTAQNAAGCIIQMMDQAACVRKTFCKEPIMTMGEWHWVEMAAFKIAGIAGITYNTCQIECQPLNSAEFMSYDVCGLTMANLTEPLDFKYSKNCPALTFDFYGKNYTSYGDSITYLNVYQKYIDSRFAFKTNVRACGGSAMAANYVYFWATAEGVYIDRPPANAPSGTLGVDYFQIRQGMCTQSRIDTIPLDTQVLTVMAGTNDWGYHIPLGTSTDAASDADENTFWAAWKSFFEKVAIRLPNCTVVVLNIPYRQNEATTTNNLGNYLEDYRNVIRLVCDMYEMPCIETDNVGIDNVNWSTYSTDAIHPNNAGLKLIGEHVADEMESI